MRTIFLNDAWVMYKAGEMKEYDCGTLPVSVYQTLLRNNIMANPYYGENEYKTQEICRDDYIFKTDFSVDEKLLSEKDILLQFCGIDTISDIYLNGELLGNTDNMHRIYKFDVKSLIKAENHIEVKIYSPINYIEEKQKSRPLYGVGESMPGYPHIRKGHSMFGWDWGPEIPDMGIWRDVKLIAFSHGKLSDIYVKQSFNDDYTVLDLNIEIETEINSAENLSLELILETADDKTITKTIDAYNLSNADMKIINPLLWNPRGYGGQNLNKLTVILKDNDILLDKIEKQLGFRTLTVNNNPDEGKFCFVCNGLEIFSMGANYIPQDQILPNITNYKIENFLIQCVNANYNTIRIWGGGYYPTEFFYDCCDKMGLIVWQDFMFACSAYLLTDDFEETIVAEFEDNIRRIRNHPSLGLWCGNNEIESMWEGWGIPEDKEAQSDYVKLFEKLIPKALEKYDPETFYWPSSPSSGGDQFEGEGCFNNSSSNFKGDQHYWDIWHNFKPLEEFRKYLLPFCSEYGFESIPSIKTIRSFAEEKDLNISSNVMENHQKCSMGNEKLMFYIAQMCRYPYSFEELIYASQYVQAEAIRSDVEHLRRNRGKCMGSLYWQVNDSNPVISWSSIDYFGRWKALHYVARRFYAPVLISCLQDKTDAIKLNISNETKDTVKGIVKCVLRDNSGKRIIGVDVEAEVADYTSKDIMEISLSRYLDTRQRLRTRYIEYSFIIDGVVVSRGTELFVRPKSFEFLIPDIKIAFAETDNSIEISLTADVFVKSVYLDLINNDCIFSDNWFDIHGDIPVNISVKKSDLSKPMILSQFIKEFKIVYSK